MTSIISRDVDWDLRWRSAGIPVSLRGQGLDDWPPQTNIGRQAAAKARYFVDTLPERLTTPGEHATREHRALVGVGLAIIGPNGTGKTDLACATATESHRVHGASIGYARASAFLAACTTCANPPRDDDERHDPNGDYQRAVRLRRRMALSSVVVLDDLGKEHKTPSNFAARKINNYLRYRHEEARPTIVTSNEPIERWAIYDTALPSFVHQAFNIIPLIGADLRVR